MKRASHSEQEVGMASSLHCPHCGATLPDRRSWSEVAISTLVPSPAVPDMATQVRCSRCGRVSAASDLRYTVADRFLPSRPMWWLTAGWLGMLVIAVLNGALREASLAPMLGEAAGRRLSTVLLLVWFAGWFWVLHRKWPLETARHAWLVGALWLAMTLAFETFTVRVLGHKPWSVVLADYDLLAGNIWLLVPLWTLLGPYVFFRAARRRTP
jgi:hypothetical protein